MTEIEGQSVRGRAPYLPIVDRPALKLPGNARVAVWTIVNVENWSAERAMPRAVLPPPMGQPLLPNLPLSDDGRANLWRDLAETDFEEVTRL